MSGGDALVLDGPVTIETVPDLVNRIPAHLDSGTRQVDFSRVTDVDSAAVALALEWQRLAATRNVQITLCNVPEALRNLANLYGVTDLLAPPAS
jgi:phospholipid transport system transporter-binding protein